MNSFLTIESFIIDADLRSIDSLIENIAFSEVVLESENTTSDTNKNKAPMSEKMKEFVKEIQNKVMAAINKLIQMVKNLAARVVNFISKIKTKMAGNVKTHKDLITAYNGMSEIANTFLGKVSEFDDIFGMITRDQFADMFSGLGIQGDTTYARLLKIKDFCAQAIINFKEKDILDGDKNIEDYYNKENLDMSDYQDFDVTNATKALSVMEKALNKKKRALEAMNAVFKVNYYSGLQFMSSNNRKAMKLLNSMVSFQNYLISGCSKIFFRMQFYLNNFIKMTPTVVRQGSVVNPNNRQKSSDVYSAPKALPRYT